MASSTPNPSPSSSPPSQSQLQTPSPPSVDQYNNTNPLIHNVALGVTPLALLALFLPPRRLDLRAIMLGGVTLWGTNQLVHDYSGRSFGQRFSSRMQSLSGVELPEKAKATQARLREEKERNQRLRVLRDEMIKAGAAPAALETWGEAHKRALLEAYERERREKLGVAGTVNGGGGGEGQENKAAVVGVAGKEKEGGDKGILEKIWMGDAPPDWKEARDRREMEALQEGGGGYLGLITDQIAEVWGAGKKKKGEEGDNPKGQTSEDAKKS